MPDLGRPGVDLWSWDDMVLTLTKALRRGPMARLRQIAFGAAAKIRISIDLHL